jgi:hypothetical protein
MSHAVGWSTVVRRRGAVAAIVAALTTGLLAGCVTAAPAADARTPASVCRPGTWVTHLDVPGPGQPSPEAAAIRLLGGHVEQVETRGNGSIVVLKTRTADRVQLRLTRASTGWWPDSYRRCSAASSSPASLQPGVWYHATRVEGAGAVDAAARTAKISVMLADQGGSPVLIARGPVNGSTVPVTVENGRVEPDRTRPAGVTAAACVDASSPDCIVDGWIGSWATRPFAVVQVDGRLQLVASGARITIAG